MRADQLVIKKRMFLIFLVFLLDKITKTFNFANVLSQKHSLIQTKDIFSNPIQPINNIFNFYVVNLIITRRLIMN